MKLRALYSDIPYKFPKIVFRDGLNVIFAQVQDASLSELDSHNLGKTFLIRVLDFALLAKVDKKHPFRVNEPFFEDFTFYLELESNSGAFITVRRAVKAPRGKAISINVTSVAAQDHRPIPL